MEPSSQDNRRIKQCRLQLEIIDTDAELVYIAKLHPDSKPTIDRARNLLGRYSHLIVGVDVIQLWCVDDGDCDYDIVNMEEVAA